jgi:hypothetical protein
MGYLRIRRWTFIFQQKIILEFLISLYSSQGTRSKCLSVHIFLLETLTNQNLSHNIAIGIPCFLLVDYVALFHWKLVEGVALNFIGD